MPQYRQDFITKEWVIVAPERAGRPDQFARKPGEKREAPLRDEKCPFCPGNESQTPPPVLVQNHGDGWRLRVVPNKFAAVNPELSPHRQKDGRFLSADGFGLAEVIIENPAHNTSLGLMSAAEVRNVIQAYKERYRALASNDNVNMVTIFRNHGPGAGTSLVHPHSQAIATPIVPPHVRHLMQQALIFHDTYGECPYCFMLDEELRQAARIVLDAKHYVVLCPYASRVPFEMKIVPKRHYSRFDEISGEEMDELAQVLRLVLKKLNVGLNDPDYNFVIATSPAADGELPYDHWRLVIVPKLTTPAGFEIGTGIFINVMPPENAAAFLREVKVD